MWLLPSRCISLASLRWQLWQQYMRHHSLPVLPQGGSARVSVERGAKWMVNNMRYSYGLG